MSKRIRITESLDIDLDRLMWCCNRCGEEIIHAKENYKRGCLICAKDPREIHRPIVETEHSWAPYHEWMNIVEFYCPNCHVMFENEYLPLGHPITHDIELDLESLQEKYAKEA